MGSDQETTERRYYGLELGVVIDNADPLEIGRVRVRVPGVVNEGTGWALPLGTVGGGSAQRGLYAVPKVGADVGVFFHRGDPDGQAFYVAGHWGRPGGRSEAPTPVAAAAGAQPEKITAFETDVFLVTYDDRDGKALLRLEDKRSGDHVEIDGVKMSVSVKATTSLQLLCDGLVQIDGVDIQIGGRKLLRGSKPIE